MALPYISPEILSQYQSHIATSGAPATTKRRVSSLKKFFEWAHKEGHTPQNPFYQSVPPAPLPTGKSTNKRKLRVIAAVSGTFGMAILLFLLIGRLRNSVPTRIAPAQQGVPTSKVQVGTPMPITSPQSQEGVISGTTVSPWTLYSKLTFKDESGEPIQTVQSITFSLFKDQETTTPVWTSTAQEVTPDAEGNVRAVIKNVPTNLFFENESLFLAANLPQGTLGERIPVSTATSLGQSSTAIVGSDGNLFLAGESPSVVAEAGNLLIEGKAVTIGTTSASDGDIEINPDGTGIVHFLFEGTGQNYLNVQAPNLTKGSLIYGIVANNSTGYDLLRLQNGSKAATRFAVDAGGSTTATGGLSIGGNIATGYVQRLSNTGALSNITGYSQGSGNFSIVQGAGDTATITKKDSALSDLLTLTLDERTKPSSGYSALTIKRYDGAAEAYGLFVDEGNTRFDGQLQLGRFTSNPGSIGTGSLIYNTTDSSVYVWNGSAWASVGGGTLTVQESDTSVSSSASVLDFLGGDFDITESPAGEANIALSTTLSSVVGVAGDFNVGGNDLTSTGDLSINPGGNDVIFSDNTVLNIGGSGDDVSFNAIGDDTAGASNVDSDDDLYIEGNLEVDGTIYGNVSGTINPGFTTGSVIFQGASGLTEDNTNFFWNDTSNLLGIGTNGPDAPVDVLSTGGAQLRLTYTDGSVYTAFNTDSSGNLNIDVTGNKVDLADDLEISGNDILDSGATSRITLGATTTLTNSTTVLSGTSLLTASSLATIDSATSLTIDATSLTLGGNATLYGGSGASETLTLDSTSNATKGNIQFFSSSNTIDPSGNLIIAGDFTVNGGDVNGPSGENIDLGEATADTITFYVSGSGELSLNASALIPSTDSGLDLGSSSSQFADLYLDGGNINLDNSTDIDIDDNTSTSLTISQGTNNYLAITTTDTDTAVTLDLPVAGGSTTTGNLFTSNIAKTINLGTGTAADTINLGTGGTGADTIAIGNNVSGTTVAITSGTGADSWSITAAGAATFGGHVILSSDANEGLSGGGLTDCDTAGTSKLLWDATTNKFSCGTDSDTGISTTTLQIAYGNDANGGNTIIALTADDDSLIFRNPDTGGTDSSYLLFLDQLAVGDVNTLELSNDGTGSEIAFTSTSPTLEIANTGTLTVTDGANTLFSIADDTAEGDVTVTGDLAVNGATSADITTSTATASVFNTNATTLNVGGAATTVSIGASTGTTTVNNDLTVTGGDINGPSGENIDLGEATADSITFYIGGSGELVLNSSTLGPASDSGLDLGSSSSQFADLYLDGGNINLDNATDIDIDDNTGSALTVSEGTNNYLAITTTNSSEAVSFGNTTTNPVYNFLGSGLTTLGGDLAINGGNITTAVTADSTLAVTGTLTANGAFDANGQVDLGDNGDTVSIDSSDWNITTTGDLSGIGSIGADGDLTITQTTPSIFLVDSTGSADDYSINVDGNAFTIVNDTDGRTELTFAGDGGITLGSAAATAINLTTDSTGNGEVVLPDDSIGPNEVFTTGQTDEYCLTYEATGSTWAWQDCGASASVAWSSLTDPTGDLTLTMAAYNTIFNWDPGADAAETNFSLTTQGEDTVAGGDEDQVLFALSQTSNATDVDEAADALLTFANNDDNDPVNSAIRFDAGGAGTDFTYGINFDAASIGTAELIFQNAETIDNTVDGTITLTAPITSLSGDLAINGGNITTAVTADSTLTVTGTLTANGALDANGQVDLGDNGDTVSIDSSDWNITTTGDLSGIGSIGADGDLTITQATPSIFLVDSTGSADDYSINVDGNAFTVVNDTDGRTELTFAGDGSITLGSAGATTINLTTDSTGNAEVVLPNSSIGPNEVFATGQTDEYCLTYEGTGSTWEWQSCSGAVTWNSLSDPTGDLTLSMADFNTTFNWDPGADAAETNFSLTTQGEDTIAGGDEDQVLLALSQTDNGVDVDEAADALVTFANGDSNDPVGDAIRFDAGGAGVDFLDGIDFSAANLNREIVFENGEALHGQTADTFTFEDDDGTDYATLSVTALTLAGDLAINGGNITTAFTADSNVTVTGTLTANGAFDANGQVDLGDNGDTVSIDSSDWDINTSGDLSGIGSIGADGDLTITQATPTISLVDTGGDDYSINVDGNAFTIVNDSDARTELTFAGDGSITLGSSGATAINLTTDSTGNAEVVLPDDAIGPNEVFTTGQTDEYCLTYEGTGSTWEWQSCTAGVTVPWSSITDPTGDLTLSMADFNTAFNWDPGADSAETNFSLTTQGEDTIAGGNEDQVLLSLSQTSNGVDVDQAADALLTLANADANDPVVNGIRFDAGAAGVDFTYGINFDAASIGTAELIFQNAETIDNTVDGTLAITAPTTSLSGDLTVTGGDINGPSGENIDLGEATADTIIFYVGGSGELSLNASALIPTTDSGLDLGSSANQFADLYLDGGNINLNGATDLDIDDNTASSFTISEGTNNYFVITTSNNTESVTLDLPAGGGTSLTGNLFTSSLGKTINIGTGTGADVINIGTGGTNADTLTFGNTGAATTFAFNSGVTTGTALSLATPSLTTGEALDITATSAPTAGGTQSVVDLNFTNNPSSNANTLRGIDLSITDGTALANTMYGAYVAADNSANTSTGTHSIYGGSFTATGKTAGTTTAIGLYASATGADSNYAAIFENGNVGIGDTSPASLLTVGSGDLFQVDSSGRIVAIDGVAHTIEDITGDLTLDSPGDITLDADGGDVVFKDGGATFATFTNTSTDLTILPAGGDLFVTGNLDVSGHAAIGANGAYNANFIVDIDETLTVDAAARGINVEMDRNFTLTADRTDAGIYGLVTLNDVVEDAFNYDARGSHSQVSITEGSTAQNAYGAFNYGYSSHITGIVDNLYGTYGQAINDSSGEITNIYGARGYGRNDGVSTNVYGAYFEAENLTTVADAANYYGIYSLVDNNADTATVARNFNGLIDNAASTNITTSTGLYLDMANAGTIGTSYGIFINDIIEGTQTNAYGIWANEGDWILDEDGGGTSGGTATGGDIILGEGQDFEFYHDGTNSNIINNTGDLYITDAGTDDVLLSTNGGNVGIGTITPTQKLSVRQDNAADILALYDGANNIPFLVADAGVATFKPTGFDMVQTCSGATCVSGDSGAFTDNTTESKTNYGTAFTVLPAAAPGSGSFYVGLDHPFNTINVDIVTANSGMSTMAVEYWNGSAWTSASATDNTALLTTDGTITFTAPGNWVANAVNGTTKYYIRIRNSVGTITVAPTAYFVTPTTGNRFYVYAQSGDANPALYVNDYGFVGIGETGPDYALEIHDAINTPTFALSDDDIAHGMTTVALTDVFAHLSSISTTAGGAQFSGLSDTDAQALIIRGIMGTTNPTDTIAAVKIVGAKKDSVDATAMADLGAAETVFQVANNDNTASLTILGDGSVGIGNATPTTALHVGTGTETHTLATGDVLISSDLEIDGIFYLDGEIIADQSGTNTVVFTTTPTSTAHTLTGSSWLVNNTANVGWASLIVDQQHDGELFTASSSGDTRFVIANNGTTTITTTNAATVASLVVSDASGTGAGKINVGTVDPIYTIGDGKYATYMAGMVGVKEEVTGNIQTDEYIPGIGYRKTIDFKTLAEGSDLWLFSKATDLKDNIDKLVVLLSAEGNNRTWYRVDDENYILSVYSTKPTNISFRLTAPRFDYALWTNYNHDEGVTGFILPEEELNGNGELDDPSEDSIANYEIEKVQVEHGFIYRLQDLAGNVINEFAKVSDFLAANITAGILRADTVVTGNLKAGLAVVDSLRVNDELISPVIETGTISPLADASDVTVQIGNENIDSGFGELLIENAEGNEVASFDTEGNATISGALEADSVKTNDVVAGKIYADEIVARNGYFGQIQTESAGGITREEIEQILSEVEESQGLLAQAASWSVNTATESGVIDEIAVENLFVTGLATVNSLSVTETITAGSDLVISSISPEGGSTLNSINTLAAPLELQSLAMAPVEIMAGKVRIETSGDVYIDANLYVAGAIEAESVTASEATLDKITTEQLIIAGTEVATPSAVINGEIESNATVGQAVVPTGVAEITIRNPKITDYTLVYITPTSPTENKTLYVKSKGAGFFTVGFSDPISVDSTFNWWVVEAQ